MLARGRFQQLKFRNCLSLYVTEIEVFYDNDFVLIRDYMGRWTYQLIH